MSICQQMNAGKQRETVLISKGEDCHRLAWEARITLDANTHHGRKG